MFRSEDNVWIYQMLGILLLISPFGLAIVFFLSRRAARTEVHGRRVGFSSSLLPRVCAY